MQRRSGRRNAVRREGGEETRLRILELGAEGGPRRDGVWEYAEVEGEGEA